ncbi:hypothetical protein [uncultured Sphingomonas sp.]|uniref:hypothetical protein n=1 Tax=uncultured Sphingomonas sp. TaxID=158754 RepID=UPI0025E5AE89|nr:hypothetical protein [uncultured Sphingomonas sp.]
MSADSAGVLVSNQIGLIILPFLCGAAGIGIAATGAVVAAAVTALLLLESPDHGRALHRADVRLFVTVRLVFSVLIAALPYAAGRGLA